MAFSAADVDRTMGHLGYPITAYWVQQITNALATVSGSVAEARIIGYLDDMDAAQAAIKAGAAGGMLKKADVLEWETTAKGGKSAPYLDLIKDLRMKLSASIGMVPFDKFGEGRGGGLGNRVVLG
jgi:hypothetical protein